MWKQYCFGEENTEKIDRKFNRKNKCGDDVTKLLYRSFINNKDDPTHNSNDNGISSFVSFHFTDVIKAEEQLLAQEEVDDDLISDNTKQQINELKVLLNGVQSNTPDTSKIMKLIGNIFSNINPQQVAYVCDCLELDKLDEVTFHSTFCQLILHVTPPISFLIGLNLIQQLLYPQVIDLKSPASRLLTFTILEWTKILPKVVIEGVIASCIKENHLGKFQVSLIVQVIKDSLADNQATLCLRECLQELDIIEERHFLILQTIMEKNVQFEEDCWGVLLAKLLSSCEQHRKNILFTKLLLTLLTKQECQVQPHNLNILSEIVNRIETFLKKPAEKALENLTKKYSNGNL